MIPCWNCNAEKPPQGPCRKCGSTPEQRFEQPAYKAIRTWLGKLDDQSLPFDALMAIPDDHLGVNFRVGRIDATMDLVIGVHIRSRKARKRPKLVEAT